jgi:hypothetical protein
MSCKLTQEPTKAVLGCQPHPIHAPFALLQCSKRAALQTRPPKPLHAAREPGRGPAGPRLDQVVRNRPGRWDEEVEAALLRRLGRLACARSTRPSRPCTLQSRLTGSATQQVLKLTCTSLACAWVHLDSAGQRPFGTANEAAAGQPQHVLGCGPHRLLHALTMQILHEAVTELSRAPGAKPQPAS